MMLSKRPYRSKLANVLNILTEGAYFFLYVGYFLLHQNSISPENETRRKSIGYAMTALVLLVILRCIIELFVTVIETITSIKQYCKKRNRVSQDYSKIQLEHRVENQEARDQNRDQSLPRTNESEIFINGPDQSLDKLTKEQSVEDLGIE